MAMIGFSAALHGPNAPGAIDRNASASLLASDSDEYFTNTGNDSARNNPTSSGLIAFSLEGNPIGDRGAESISLMI